MERMTAAEFRASVLPNTISEDQLLRWVVHLARLYGWLVHHSLPARRQSGKVSTALMGDKGLPDLILVRAPRVIFAELKSAKGRLSPEQAEWRSALEAVPGVEYHLWKPTDREEIVEALLRV